MANKVAISREGRDPSLNRAIPSLFSVYSRHKCHGVDPRGGQEDRAEVAGTVRRSRGEEDRETAAPGRAYEEEAVLRWEGIY